MFAASHFENPYRLKISPHTIYVQMISFKTGGNNLLLLIAFLRAWHMEQVTIFLFKQIEKVLTHCKTWILLNVD